MLRRRWLTSRLVSARGKRITSQGQAAIEDAIRRIRASNKPASIPNRVYSCLTCALFSIAPNSACASAISGISSVGAKPSSVGTRTAWEHRLASIVDAHLAKLCCSVGGGGGGAGRASSCPRSRTRQTRRGRHAGGSSGHVFAGALVDCFQDLVRLCGPSVALCGARQPILPVPP
jgi:hypothetical protein